MKTPALPSKFQLAEAENALRVALAFFISTVIWPQASLAGPPPAATNQPAPPGTASSGLHEPDPIDFDDHAGYVHLEKKLP